MHSLLYLFLSCCFVGGKFISILRDPIDVILSAFTAFSWDNDFSSLDDFLNATSQSRKLSRSHLPYRNLQSYVFGLRPWEFNRKDRVERKLEEIAEEFDLLMINDERRFSQSLVLLKELMGWTFEDVAVLLVNKRVESRVKLSPTEDQRKQILKANYADQMLYGRFLEVFDRRVEAFGKNKVKSQVECLIRRTEELMDLCVTKRAVDDYDVYSYTVTDEGRTIPYCIYMASPEMKLTAMLIDRHNAKYKGNIC